jgi:2-polyprenyl-3-methyl-5-hydroxy-6-metoxy-1,4-benzoquinol methylase
MIFKKDTSEIFNVFYKGILIKADARLHVAVKEIFKTLILPEKKYSVLDIATGAGAMARRLIDEFPNIELDCNDLARTKRLKGIKENFRKDLNANFNFNKKYDFIIAIEIIEHLENPSHFIKKLKNHLKPNGVIVLTTPNANSFFDRIWFFIYGYHFYFGKQGILNSGGHITVCFEWLLKYIARNNHLQFESIHHNFSHYPLLGIKAKILLFLLSPLRLIIHNSNDKSFLICLLKKRIK